MKRKSVTAVISIFALLSVPSVSYAAGFNSSFSEFRDGAQNRTWHDDTDGTTSATTRGCWSHDNEGSHKLDLELKEPLRFRPDPSLGVRSAVGCYGGTANNAWGGVYAGNWYIRIGTWSWQRVSASYIGVEY
ncbi:hypothetical protein [Corynebacterium oculi]|uniref:hypothetical protein n=1 Tax=Corynebacterium oculi TaxID=1544416 RepID=UPI0012378744|nr:hypothetical protein [Corynebacterium oculi]